MNKFMLNLFLGLALLFSNQQTQCINITTNQAKALVATGCVSLASGLYLLSKQNPNVLRNILIGACLHLLCSQILINE